MFFPHETSPHWWFSVHCMRSQSVPCIPDVLCARISGCQTCLVLFLTLTAVSGKISVLVLTVGFRKAEASTFISCGVSLRGGKKRVGLFAWKGCVSKADSSSQQQSAPQLACGSAECSPCLTCISSLGLHVLYEPGCHYCPLAS